MIETLISEKGSPLKAVALSAGLGTRLRPATLTKPKPLIPFLGVPLILYSIDRLRFLGVKEIGINTHYLAEVLKSEIEKMNLELKFNFYHEVQLMGTAGALYGFKSWLQEDREFILCNSDEVFFVDPIELKKAQQYHQHSKNLATFLVCKNPLVGQEYGGIWTSNSESAPQKVEAIQKKAVGNLFGWHYLGWCFLSSKVLSLLPDPSRPCDILHDILIHMLKDSKVEVYPLEATWFDAGDTSKFEKSQKDAREFLKVNAKACKWLSSLPLQIL